MTIYRTLAMGVASVLAWSLLGGNPASAQRIPPPPLPPPPPNLTLWQFLGIPQAVHACKDKIANKHGHHPKHERKPHLLRLADPQNFITGPELGPIAVAAGVKFEEDLAPQKIKAIRYLAGIGCGCYDKDGKVTAAMVIALNDCTPAVRRAAAQAIGSAITRGACEHCNEKCCCKEEIVKKLAEMAYEKDDKGCWLEPNDAVRAAAMTTLHLCCQGMGPVGPIFEEPPVEEGPPGRPPVEGPFEGPREGPVEPAVPLEQPEVDPVPPPPPAADPANPAIPPDPLPLDTASRPQSSRRHAQARPAPAPAQLQEQSEQPKPYWSRLSDEVLGESEAASGGQAQQAALRQEVAPTMEQAAAPALPVAQAAVVAGVDAPSHSVYLQFDPHAQLPVGSRVAVYQNYLLGRAMVAELEVVEADTGVARAHPAQGAMLSKIRPGSQAVLLR